MKLLYNMYRCFLENGWWYTWHKILFKLFGCQDPETDPRWSQKREAFLNRHPERRSGRQMQEETGRRGKRTDSESTSVSPAVVRS